MPTATWWSLTVATALSGVTAEPLDVPAGTDRGVDVAVHSLAKGGSDFRSTSANSAIASISGIPSTTMSVTSGALRVSAHVLSTITTSTRFDVSIAVALLSMLPRAAPRPGSPPLTTTLPPSFRPRPAHPAAATRRPGCAG